MTSVKKPIIGITLGDLAGIGPEITAKALSEKEIRDLGRYKIIGNNDIFRQYCSSHYQNCEIIDSGKISFRKIKLGQPNEESAKAALFSLKESIHLLKTKQISALVTAPVSKEAISRLGKKFHGHTEFLAQAFRVKNFEMMFVSPTLRTLIVTRHIPLQKISRAITREKILDTIQLSHKTLQENFRIKQPKIAVCGLNPHAGEGGEIGREEIEKIIPAIQEAQRKKISVEGPFPADTLFTPDIVRHYDLVIAMYHDQGLIPIKTLYFAELVNLTIGLPFIRTSPAHGTAFNIAKENKADPSSMKEAIKLAAGLSR